MSGNFLVENNLPECASKKRVSIYEESPAKDLTENIIENQDGSITRTRCRELLTESGTKRTEINSETRGGIIKLDASIKPADIKYNSEEISVVKKGGKEITTRIRIQKDDDGNIIRTTIKEIRHRDGSVIYETNVETMGDPSIQKVGSKFSVDNSQESVEPSTAFKYNLAPANGGEININEDKMMLEIPSSIHSGSVECLIKKKYENDYQLSESQYNLIREYFDRFQRDELIPKELFKDHLVQVLVEKKKVVATEEDIANALDIIDSDSNDLDFDEFIDFMTLFFAKKSNLKTRITNVLNGHQWTHAQTGQLSPDEADKYQLFLYKFYNVKKVPVANFQGNMFYIDFASEIKPLLEANVFVKK